MINVYILAAGESERYGAADKLQACFNGKSLLQHAIDAALAADVGTVSVVSTVSQEATDTLIVPAGEPLSARLHAVAEHAQSQCADALILLGDMPLISAESIRRVASQSGELARACHGDSPGFPVKVANSVLDGLLALRGDQGLSQAFVLEDFKRVETPGEEGFDIDTPEALDRLVSRLSAWKQLR